MSELSVRDLSVSFGDRHIFRGLDLSFPLGGITCVTGPSGCGKTTLLRVLAGLLVPESGSIDPKPSGVSFVFQEDRLCEDFSAYSNVRFVTGKSVSRDEILSALGSTGLREFAFSPVRAFSGGMKRRVAVVRAVLFPSGLLLLDEPFKGLDREAKKRTVETVLRYSGGKTVVCATHDEEEISLLGAGKIELPPPPGEG